MGWANNNEDWGKARLVATLPLKLCFLSICRTFPRYQLPRAHCSIVLILAVFCILWDLAKFWGFSIFLMTETRWAEFRKLRNWAVPNYKNKLLRLQSMLLVSSPANSQHCSQVQFLFIWMFYRMIVIYLPIVKSSIIDSQLVYILCTTHLLLNHLTPSL